MTVAELIEKLQELPGDPDLLLVTFDVTLSRPYIAPPGEQYECHVDDRVTREGVFCRLSGWAYVE